MDSLWFKAFLRMAWPLFLSISLLGLLSLLGGCQTVGAQTSAEVKPKPRVPATLGKDFIIQDFPSADGSVICFVLTLPGPVVAGVSCIPQPGT